MVVAGMVIVFSVIVMTFIIISGFAKTVEQQYYVSNLLILYTIQ